EPEVQPSIQITEQDSQPELKANPGFSKRFSKFFSRKPNADPSLEGKEPPTYNPLEPEGVQADSDSEAQQQPNLMITPESLRTEPSLAEPMGRPTIFGKYTAPGPEQVPATEEPVQEAPAAPEVPEVVQPTEVEVIQPMEVEAVQESPAPETQTIQPEVAQVPQPEPQVAPRPSRFGRFFSKKSPEQGRSKNQPAAPPEPVPALGDGAPSTSGDTPSNGNMGVMVNPPEIEVSSMANAPTSAQAQTEEPSNETSPAVEMPVPRKQERQGVVLTQVNQEVKPEVASPPVRAMSTRAVPVAREQPKAPQYNFVARYQIFPDNPEVYSGIIKDPETGGYRYVVVEPQMTLVERQVYAKITRLLVDELEVDMARLKNSKSAQAYLFEETKKLAKKYDMKIPPDAYRKVAYYFTRDYIKLGRIEVLMNDPRIEDISCDGPNIPLFIWHRDYESIPTSIMFKDDEELNTFASKLAYVSGKHISIANPIVDATLPDGSRIQITYGKEVTRKGSTFTIRKFKGDPITIVDMLKYNTISPELGAYLWYLIEKRMSLLVAGGTASGKTTTLNALSMFIPPDQKIVSVEDTPELNLSHKNWIQSISRGAGVAGEITLFDLLKAALRQRPDIIIVGEVRGVEAYTLFQAIASVTGDTLVLIKQNGEVKLTPIGGFVDTHYDGDAERLPVHVDGAAVLSFNKEGEVKFSPVQYVLRHRAQEVYTVRYAGGAVRATGSHSVFVFDKKGKIVPRVLSEVTAEDIMVSFCGSQIERREPKIDAQAILQKVSGHKVLTERLKAYCPHCGSSGTKKKGKQTSKQRFWCNDCRRTFRESPELRFLNELQPVAGEQLVSFQKSLAVPREIPVDEDFARVLGIYMADGCVKTHKGSSNVVFCLGAEEKKHFAQDTVDFFQGFGCSPSVEDRGTYVMLEYNHSPLAEIFRDFCGAKLQEKHIPAFIWDAPEAMVSAFLSGWEADGRRTLKGRRSVPITSVRKDLVEQLSWLARLNSRSTYISERSSKYPSVYISTRGQSRADSIPAGLLLALKEKLGSAAFVHLPKKENKTISKARAERALQEIISTAKSPMTWEAATLVSTISSLLEGSLIASRVLSIEKGPHDGFVYDISVPGTEAFFGGESPVALHNTGHGGLGTIHADSVEAAINRMTSEPMNVPKPLLGSTLDCLIMQLRIKLKDKSVRRMVHVAEIVGHESSSDQIVLNNAFKWDPVSDQYQFSGRSRLFEKITKRFGTPPEKIRRDLEDRKIFLKYLMAANVRDYKDVSQQIREFYSDKETVIERAMRTLGGSDIEIG
ncbi:MAG: ATPase, T2SS/T4P/T4SS family, partial [Thaumarchaeota archaeon]|nr:ATPase, T2SS/T4P/T4SS family [Nitrososphaerota archaeon]